MLHDFFWGTVKLGLFLEYGVPAIVGIVVLISCLAAEGNPLSFKGRTGRKAYLIQYLVSLLIVFAAGLFNSWFSVLVILVVGTGMYAAMARRIRDIGGSNRLALAVPLLVLALTFVEVKAVSHGLAAVMLGVGFVPGEKNRKEPKKIQEDDGCYHFKNK
ncbi:MULTISPECIES: DUF805 domain-containing protein [Acidaminococcus]|jgi:uncharacterized membrane protein YhaH (DUF805 family)|uniref:DUF805 domain-containing protein n=1 Tax=Acidaminococcus TaxID=904 RepID=UPI001E3E5F2B|nr:MULTISPECIES: DUF805 domain-containing protein [Acidaminococcus]MCD2436227.1 DUF805 domain-containing protein [Acidaminococcus hominis]MEE1597332.1 DUF805 domain-containing protein [Acidaminococcus fermentans]MEE4121597.1 DUF805 domain-containing protein [Acidaminococcus fermentans]